MTDQEPAAVAGVESAPPPRWTHKRLTTLFTACYGTGPRGGVNAEVAADNLGVSISTIYRWLTPGPTQYQLHIPRRRIAQLQMAPAMDEIRAAQQYRHALKAIETIDDGEPWKQWEDQGWLQPHRVAIVKPIGKPWNQLVVSRVHRSRTRRSRPSVPAADQPAPAGAISKLRAWEIQHYDDITLTEVVVPHWFHAQALVRAVMVRQWWWRVYPASSELATGRTRVWMSDAPPVHLRALARAVGVPVSHTATESR